MLACGVLPFLISSLIRSLIKTFESIAIPTVSAIAARPGKVNVACIVDKSATRRTKLILRAIDENRPNNM